MGPAFGVGSPFATNGGLGFEIHNFYASKSTDPLTWDLGLLLLAKSEEELQGVVTSVSFLQDAKTLRWDLRR